MAASVPSLGFAATFVKRHAAVQVQAHAFLSRPFALLPRSISLACLRTPPASSLPKLKANFPKFRRCTRTVASSAATAQNQGEDLISKIPPDNRIPATIITGFLGSGKTTLLNHILTADHGKKIAVIENEFGEIDIDGSLVAAKTTGAEDIVMLNNGCLCCTVRGDLVRMVSELLDKKKGKFDHIVIETTGLANPAPIIQTFYSEDRLFNDVKLDGVVTLVDAKHAGIHLDEVKPKGVVNEAVEQIAYADRIILNKIDLVGEQELSSLVQRVKSINGMASLKRTEYGKVDLDYVLGIGGFDLESSGVTVHLRPTLFIARTARRSTWTQSSPDAIEVPASSSASPEIIAAAATSDVAPLSRRHPASAVFWLTACLCYSLLHREVPVVPSPAAPLLSAAPPLPPLVRHCSFSLRLCREVPAPSPSSAQLSIVSSVRPTLSCVWMRCSTSIVKFRWTPTERAGLLCPTVVSPFHSAAVKFRWTPIESVVNAEEPEDHSDHDHCHGHCDDPNHHHHDKHEHEHEHHASNHAHDHSHSHDHAHDHIHDPGVSSVSIVCEGNLDLNKANIWLGTLLLERSDDIYRMKGLLSVDGLNERFVFQGVHDIFQGSPDRPWAPEEKRINKIVFIGKNLDAKAIEEGFRACLLQ
ncbi:COBW domain-containing protein 1 [Nymphaea thermarum]|nr:COBW domain-containing protein 1 [Nymphaea thermarum]